MSTSSTTNQPCTCNREGCSGTELHDRKVIKSLLPAWKNAINLESNAKNSRTVSGLALQISSELEYCSGSVKQICASYGIYVAQPTGIS